MSPPRFVDARHALYVGWVWGLAMKHGVALLPVTDAEGNYTDQMQLVLDDGHEVTVVVPPPPADWTPDE